MKHLKIFFLLLVVALSFSMPSQAQVFSTMPEKQRNEKLIAIARKVYHNPVFKEYYNDYGESGKTKVTSYVTTYDPSSTHTIDGVSIGRLQYIVSIYSKKNNKAGGSFCIISVYISDKIGKAWEAIMGNNGWIYSHWSDKEVFE